MWHYVLISLGVLAVVFVLIMLYRHFFMNEKTIFHLPLKLLGLNNIPAFPVRLREIPPTLLRIANRQREAKQAKAGLTAVYTIQGFTSTGYNFAFDKNADETIQAHTSTQELQKTLNATLGAATFLFQSNLEKRLKSTHGSEISVKDSNGLALTDLFLDDPAQFSLAWTALGNMHKTASENLLPTWVKSLTDAEAATEQFWAIVSKYSAAYNLLVVKKVDEKAYQTYKNDFKDVWTAEMDNLYQNKLLYVIDLRIYENIESHKAKGFTRFTPATFTFLKQDAITKKMTPFAISVAGYKGSNKTFYEYKKASDSSWIYALQASKTSLTVYGIWIGHVYHWHIVTAAMIMTMFNTVPKEHSIYKIFAPQANYTIGFNNSLALLWTVIAPPTSLTTSFQLLELLDIFAKNRTFFDDDPINTLENMGLKKEDFSVQKDWDMYPIIGYYLHIWNMVKEYVTVFVETSYKNDVAVFQDKDLQQWIKASASTEQGNIKGLPTMDSKENLIRVLTSILYRVTIHGIPNLENSLVPSMTFVANYPPCLQNDMIPEPNSIFDTKELLKYMPNTGTIGEMITFYHTFVYTTPYEPFVPLEGVNENLFFENGINDPRNQALIKFRQSLIDFIAVYTIENQIIPNIPPNQSLYHQWSLSVEV